MRLPDESINLISADPIQPSQVKTYRTEFPLSGEGWRRLRLTFHHTITAGGTVPNALGAYLFLKNLSLKTGDGENPVDCPGMGLYLHNFLMHGVEPVYTTVIAGAGTFHSVVDIPFVFPFLARKEDLSIDSGRYNMIELQIQSGSLVDFQRTIGTAALTTTMDMTLFRNKSCWEESGKPLALPFIKHMAPFQAVTKGYADLESAKDLILFGFHAHAADLVTWGTVGNAYEGTPADCLDDISFYDNLNHWLRLNKLYVFQEERAHYSNNRAFTGVYPWVFSREGSYKSGLPTGDRSEMKFVIGNGNVGAPTTPQVDLVLFGTRSFR